MFESLKIIALSVAAACIYGILHDQITAHLCVEYFTIAHPTIFHTTSPFLLAIGWGVVATWPLGLLMGILAAVAARFGSPPRVSASDILPLILLLLLVMAILATVAGSYGAYGMARGWLSLTGQWDRYIPRDKWVAFNADAYAHLMSYASGIMGGLAIIGWILVHRITGHTYRSE